MPARNEIQQEILTRKGTAQDDVRRRYLKELADHTKRDTVIYASAFADPKSPQIPGIMFSITPEDIQGFMSALHGLKGDSLDLILHSPGGSMEVADQIVQYLRAKYKHIRAIIPQNAMSAATMIACACDSIIMGKHSALGPIDPQVTFPTATGTFTSPAQAILDEFEQAKQEIKTDQTTIPLWASRIQAYPHGFLQLCQTTLVLAREKVAEWLAMYMFAGDGEASTLSKNIADWLGNAKEHKTHGRPISIMQARDKGLKVESLEDDQDLQEKVMSVFHATMVTFLVTDCVKLVENQNGRGIYRQVQVQMMALPTKGAAG
ncbi:MAG: hypothetical protein JW902_12270 [Syntrophaceae bacterium]|nr:hypothetical protein [Syntrophaceae bacterium]